VTLRLEWRREGEFRRFQRALAALGDKRAKTAMKHALNRAGDMARTEAGQALAGQTGLGKRYVAKRLKAGTRKATAGRLVYAVRATGGDIPLKYFDPKETRKGVSARPFGERRVFPHTFIKGGLFPNRKTLNMGGHVFEPASGIGKWGRPFEKAESGVVLPAEMVKGATAKAWERTGQRRLRERIEHEIRRLTGGVVS